MRLFRVGSTVARLATVAVLAGLAGTAISSTSAAAQPDAAPIAPALTAQVEAADKGERVQALVMSPNVPEHHGGYDAVVNKLRKHGADSQPEVMRHLKARNDITVLNRLWLTNM